MPLIVAGLRLASVSTIGLVTVTSIMGDKFGGLGFFILEGYRRSFATELYFGAIPSIVLAIGIDILLARLQRSIDAVGNQDGARRANYAEPADLTWTPSARPSPGSPMRSNWSGPNGIPVRLFEHVAISGVSLAIAVAIALPIGLYIGHTGRFAGFAVNSANLWRALPSLAVIAMALPITAAIDPQAGFKIYPTVVAMVVLGVPPIMINTYSGIAGVDRDLVEAARGQGMSERQVLTRLELPLAVPVDRHRDALGRDPGRRDRHARRDLWLRRPGPLPRRRHVADQPGGDARSLAASSWSPAWSSRPSFSSAWPSGC